MKKILLLLLVANLLSAQTERRLALLIGNNNYNNSISSLRSPFKDVDDMSKALRDCGFEVMQIVKDGSKERIDKAIIEFSNRLKDYDVGMFYYSGHGAEVDGRNYIVPIDLPMGFSKEDIEYRCVNTDWLQNRIASAGAYNKTFIVVLDACRNNPFKSLSARKDVLDASNWAPPKNIPSGTIVCYAASSGQIASDGGSTVNSPYTARFLKHMKVPNLTIESIFKRVRIEMSEEEQEPQENTKLRTDFYFIRKSEPEPNIPAPLSDDRMIFIPGGTFEMGSSDGEADEKPPHQVEVSSFFMSKYEVTVDEFRQFVNATGYVTDAEKNNNAGSYFWFDGKWNLVPDINWRHNEFKEIQQKNNHPVIHVSWNDAEAYCEWLSRATGRKYRLPSEAEWEYAAGNGRKHTKYSWGNAAPAGKSGGNVADEAGAKLNNWTRNESNIFMNYDDGFGGLAPVGSFYPNDFGLYDMTGNVWEWCSDWFKGYPGSSGITDLTGASRVYRGGSWIGRALNCRSAYRHPLTPDHRGNSVGFRVVSPK